MPARSATGAPCRACSPSARRPARSLASGAQRPREGGGRQGPGSFTADYGAMTRSEQLRFKQRILEASARGEKLYP